MLPINQACRAELSEASQKKKTGEPTRLPGLNFMKKSSGYAVGERSFLGAHHHAHGAHAHHTRHHAAVLLHGGRAPFTEDASIIGF